MSTILVRALDQRNIVAPSAEQIERASSKARRRLMTVIIPKRILR